MGRSINYKFIGVLVILILALFCNQNNFAEQTKKNREQIVREKVEKWQSLYGPIDFAEDSLFQCMVYLHPQAINDFKKIKNEVLSKEIKFNHDLWLNRFFKGTFLENIQSLAPYGYYLNEGRTESSLLLFKTRFDDSNVFLMENYNLIFLIVEPDDFEKDKGFSQNKLIDILMNWANVKSKNKEALIEAFDFDSNNLKIGQVFSNNNSNLHIAYIRDWKDFIIGFISTNGICVMFFKAYPERAQAGFPYDFNWLNKGLKIR